MRRKPFWVATFFVFILEFCTIPVSFAFDGLWPKKDGEVCFDVYQNCPIHLMDEPSGLVRLWVMNTGNNNYLVHGTNTEPHPDYPPKEWDGSFSTQLTNGNAIVAYDKEIQGDKVVMHMTSSGYSTTELTGGIKVVDEVRGWLGTVELPVHDLSGCFVGVGINYYPLDPGNEEIKCDGEQALIYTTCPE